MVKRCRNDVGTTCVRQELLKRKFFSWNFSILHSISSAHIELTKKFLSWNSQCWAKISSAQQTFAMTQIDSLLNQCSNDVGTTFVQQLFKMEHFFSWNFSIFVVSLQLTLKLMREISLVAPPYFSKSETHVLGNFCEPIIDLVQLHTEGVLIKRFVIRCRTFIYTVDSNSSQDVLKS